MSSTKLRDQLFKYLQNRDRNISQANYASTVRTSGIKAKDCVEINMDARLTTTVNGKDQMLKGNEVVQVIVLHLDLFTCGTCGKQATDILEHIIHKSQHKVSELFTCELCKLVVSTKQCLFQHYRDVHNLSSILLQADLNQAEKNSVVVAHNGESDTQHVTWDLVQHPAPKDEELGDQMESSLLYQVNDIMQHEVRENLETGEDSTHVPSVSSKTVSRSLLKAAKRTMLNSARRDVSCARVQPTSVSPMKCLPSRRPPILRGPMIRGSGNVNVKYKSKPPVNTVSVTPITSLTDCNMAKNNVQYLISGLNEESLNIHREQCLHCDYSSGDKEELSTHMRMKHKEGLEFQERLEIVTEEKSPCKKEVCTTAVTPTREKRPRKTLQHRKVERQDLPGVYPCNQCGKSFKRLRYLRKHIDLHKNDKQFICEECGKIFKCKGYLRVHMRTHENNEKLFTCNQCEFSSSINAAIHAHRQIHSQGSVLCDICGYAYTDNSTLAKHKRVHDLSRPFACNIPGCMWRFKTEIMCKAHIRAHTTEGKFRCAYCGYVFRHKHHLQRHESNVHGVKHEKSRAYNQKTSTITTYDNLTSEETKNSVNIIISTNYDSEGLHFDHNGMAQQYMIIQPDDECGELTYETTDITGFNPTYTLLHSEDIHTDEQTV